MVAWPGSFSGRAQRRVPIRPSPTLFFWLVGAFVLTLLPHIEQFPAWVTAAVLIALVIRAALEFRRLPLPSIGLTSSLALSLLAGIYLQFHTLFGRDAGTSLMAGLLAIKFYELRGPRDVALVIFSSFFVVMSALLYSQTIELFIYCLIMMWVLTGLLLRTHMGDSSDNKLLGMLGQSAVIFVQALPLAVFLFFFFPRYSGQLPLGVDDASIGLTDKVDPGSISRLSNDDSTAMRVTFNSGNSIPSVDTMYWRALVLWNYRDNAWTPGPEPSLTEEEEQPEAASGSDIIDQTIVIWPHYRNWLFALDSPVRPAQNAMEDGNWSTLHHGEVLRLRNSRETIDHKEEYEVESALLLKGRKLSPEDEKRGLQLPTDNDGDKIDPRVRELADQLHRESGDTRKYIWEVLRYFRQQGFAYNDSPGAGGKNELADFLFKTKSGFCEHYASAFAVLMRLGHCPARLVVGYRGGQYNPYKKFYTVKQSNAHAWDEVWIPSENHWLRVDPTAVISGTQIVGTSSASNQSETRTGLSIEVAHHRLTLLSGAYLPDWMRRGMLELQLRRQQVEADWDDWVFSYDPQTQFKLAQALGFGPETRSAMILACLLTIGLCAIVLRKLMQQKQPTSPVEDLYAKFCRNMAQRGIPRASWEGPLAYAERVAEAFPEKKAQIHDVGWIVALSRYGRSSVEPSATKQLKTLLTSITAT